MPDPPGQSPITRVVDLTQPLSEATVLWPGSTPFRGRTTNTVESDGFFARTIETPEHAATHLDAPAHFDPGGPTVDQIPAERLVVASVMLDVSDRCAADPDFAVTASDVERFESAEGRVAPGSAVLLRTGWDAYHADPARYLDGADAEDLHFPGYAESAARLLIERGVVGIGIDTLSVDPGCETDLPVHELTLSAGLWHLECLIDLGRLPSRGFTLFAGALALAGGSGAPARVVASVSSGGG